MLPIRVPRLRALLLSTLVAVLAATVVYALQRELTARPSIPDPGAVPQHQRALAADEEAFAIALWPIHQSVTTAAIRMSFAGIAYKTEDPDPRLLAEKVRLLRDGFRAALAEFDALPAPASLEAVHARYRAAMAAYADASSEMLKVTEDGQDTHLIAAQGMSMRASEDMLRVGDVLWPGAEKPH